MRLLDVTRPLGPETRVYPGDPPVRLRVVADIARGDPARVSVLTIGTHAGTHVDAPRHLDGAGSGVDGIPLGALVGPALVVQAAGPRVERRDIRALPRGAPPRILLRGRPVLAPGAARELVLRRVRLVGTDGPSLDPVGEPDLLAHRILLSAGIALLEGLDLEEAPAGRYELIALPLLIPGADGAPARAILRRPAPPRSRRR